jgi:hypothetical protein
MRAVACNTEGKREREVVVIVLKIALGRLGGSQSVSRRPVQRKWLVLPAAEHDRPARNRSLLHSLVGRFWREGISWRRLDVPSRVVLTPSNTRMWGGFIWLSTESRDGLLITLCLGSVKGRGFFDLLGSFSLLSKDSPSQSFFKSVFNIFLPVPWVL